MPPAQKRYADNFNSETVVQQGRTKVVLTRSIESNEIRIVQLEEAIQKLKYDPQEIDGLVEKLLEKLNNRSVQRNDVGIQTVSDGNEDDSE